MSTVLTYKIRNAEGTIRNFTQAEIFHEWESGRLTGGEEHLSNATAKWEPLFPMLEVAWKDAQARGRVYHVAVNDRRHGPFTLDEVTVKFAGDQRARYIGADMEDWLPTSSLAPKPNPPNNGAPVQPPQLVRSSRTLVKAQRSRGLYCGLGLVAGLSGLHDFYAGRTLQGVFFFFITLAGSIIALNGARIDADHAADGVILGMIILGIEAVVVFMELLTVDKDGDGDPFCS